VVPLKKVMVPVGVPVPEVGFTLAVRVTPLVAPTLTEDGVTLAVVVVAVLAGADVTVKTAG
jgi:hypothetical protein